ncbi:MAG: DUF2933 domain-containing protein [Syntrophomonadaceae bacterium]|nr:DUF2933 domain-containing protein [Syntrophomonadaceae bacterium]
MFDHDDHKPNDSDHKASGKAGPNNWLPWMLVAVMGGLLVLQYLGNAGSAAGTVPLANGFKWLPILAGLACPLMMLFMMSGHGRHADSNDQGEQNGGCCGGHQK